ncbi:MAG TPA: NAD(P)H-hydrate dehydratase [Archaeoglobaceae archaeon]|nr:NAD(P)H-hydrate dehydratase [Archaeoglobaceae archaeon]
METITAEEMVVLDTNCEYYGLSRLQLMENAGRCLAEEIMKLFDSGNLTIYAGLGNNGGDAFVSARFLKGFNIRILLMGKSSEIKTDIARRNLRILKESRYEIIEIRDSTMLEKDESDIIVDAMLGTGVRGGLREPYLTAVSVINSSKAFKVSVDVPTGMNPDTGEYEIAVIPDLTVTFHKMKPGLKKLENVAVRDIGIPEFFEKLTGPGDVKKTYRRIKRGHKGTHGKVLVIGGGPYSGAPALAAIAAYAAGADLVVVAVPESVYEITASFSPNLIVKKLKGDEISEKHIRELSEISSRFHVSVIGMGTENKSEFAEEFLKYVDKAVLDAGALTTQVPEDAECIMTPHRTEFRNIFGFDVENEKDVMKAAGKSNSVILLKSVEDIISDGERVKINRTGNAGMTVGGTGDLLAGIAGAFLCNENPFWSACSAAFINGYAGDMCFNKAGYNYTAMDMVEKIPLAVKESIEFV